MTWIYEKISMFEKYAKMHPYIQVSGHCRTTNKQTQNILKINYDNGKN